MTHETQREYDQLKSVADTGRYKIRVNDDEPYLPGKRGQIEPFSLDGHTLAAFTDKPTVLKQMLTFPFITRHQIGQSEGSVIFSFKHFSEMAVFLQLRKKRPRPSAEQMVKGETALRDFWTRHRTKKAGEKRRSGTKVSPNMDKRK